MNSKHNLTVLMFITFIHLFDVLSIKGGVGVLKQTPLPTIKTSKIVNQEPITQVVEAQKQKEEISDDDKYMLAKIAMAEAEGESTKSKALVIATVLNRVKSNEFPNTVKEVIFQKSQFTPTSNGRWEKVEPNDDCYKALNMVLKGEINSQGSLYFESCSNANNWHSKNLKYLFEIDAFRFYK